MAESEMYNAGGINKLNCFKRNIEDIRSGKNIYNTNELDGHLGAVSRGLDTMKLYKTFYNDIGADPNPDKDCTYENRESANHSLSKAHTFLNNDYRTTMEKTNISSLDENQIREHHYWAEHNLKGMRNELNPLMAYSHKKVEQFCDNVGVTDRYTGYRHNLAKKQDSSNCPGNWRSPSGSCASRTNFVSEQIPDRKVTGRFHIDYDTKQGHMKSVTFQDCAKTGCSGAPINSKVKIQSPQEAAGINTIYTGTTEYYDRYVKRPLSSERPDREYKMNPTPDFSQFGKMRPFELPKIESEYQHNYEWPDGKKINPLPWRSVTSCNTLAAT